MHAQEVLGQLDALLAGDGAGGGGGAGGGVEEPELEEETRALAQRARRLVAAKARPAARCARARGLAASTPASVGDADMQCR
jgi:hypothetical protein